MHKLWRIWIGGSMVFAIAFLLNFPWEVMHAVWLYAGHLTMPVVTFTRMAIYATFIDAVLVFGIFCAGCLLFKGECWLQHYRSRELIFTMVLGIVIAAIIEIKAIVLRQWEYTPLMPTMFGIGLSPLVQLAVTGALSMYLGSKLLHSLYWLRV